MCDELVERLRYCSEEQNGCGMCALSSDCVLRVGLLTQAANAIEELSMKLHGDEAAIAGMKREIARMVVAGKPRWIPMTERPPEEELRFYSCYTNKGVVVECLWTNNKYGLGPCGEWGWRLMDVPQYQHITHWMPLPEPPKEEA